MEDLNKVIDQIVTEKTMSLEAVDAIKQMRERNNTLRETNSRLEKTNNDYAEKLITFQEDIKKLKEERDHILAMDSAFKVREEKATRQECEVEKHKAVSDTYSTVFQIIFRNTTVRRTVSKDVITPLEGGEGQYSNQMPRTERDTLNESITETEE